MATINLHLTLEEARALHQALSAVTLSTVVRHNHLAMIIHDRLLQEIKRATESDTLEG